MRKFLKKYNPKIFVKYIFTHKRTFFLSLSLLFLCASFAFTIIFGLLERDGIYNFPAQTNTTNVTGPALSATAIPTPSGPLTKYYFRTNMNAIGAEPGEINSIMVKPDDDVAKTIIRHILEGLVRLDKNGEVTAGVAESWSSSEDNRDWTFNLRKDSLWQDKSKVTSNDFKAAYDLHISKNSPYKDSMSQLFSEVLCPDDYTIIYKLKQPDKDFLKLLCQPQFMPVQKSFYEANESSYGKDASKISYNGPWYVILWYYNEKISLLKNDNYWNKEEIALTNLEFLSAGNPVSKFDNFVKGDRYDLLFISPVEIEMYRNAGFKPLNYPDGYVKYLNFNTQNSYLKNKDLQMALSLSVNRKKFAEEVIKGGATQVPGYDHTLDLKTAKQHLNAAKAALGNDITTKLTITTVNIDMINLSGLKKDEFSPSKMYAEALAKQWKEYLGITVKVKSLSLSEYIDEMQKGENMMLINSQKYNGTMPGAPLYYTSRLYVANGRIKDIILSENRDLDLYYARLATG